MLLLKSNNPKLIRLEGWKRHLIHQEFGQFYDGECISVKNDHFSDNKSYCIKNCLFENLKDREIHIICRSKFLLEDSAFTNVSIQSGEGGAVLMNCGEYVHNRICSFNCSAPSFGQYCYCYANNNSLKNFVLESSLSSSSKNPIGKSPIFLLQGIKCITKTNISYFRTNTSCGYQFASGQTESNSNYSSIINNTSTNEYCIRNGAYSALKIIRSNIIKNSVKDHVISNDWGNTLIVECNIINNSGNNTFSVNSNRNKIEVINCYLRNNDKTLGNVVFSNTHNEQLNLGLKQLPEKCYAKQKYSFSEAINILHIKGIKNRRR